MTLYDHMLKKQRKQLATQKSKQRIARLHNAEPTEPEEKDGVEDLPDAIAVTIAAAPITQPQSQPPKREVLPPDIPENLVRRMAAIKERIFWLRAVYATTLSQECAIEANRYLVLFQDLAAQLRVKAPVELEKLVRGHESLLESPPVIVKPTIPLATQHWCEIRAEAQRYHEPRRERPPGYLSDGLQQFL